MIDPRKNKVLYGILIFIVLSVLNQARSQDPIDQMIDNPQPALPVEAIPPLLPQQAAPAEPIQPPAPTPDIQPPAPTPQIQPAFPSAAAPQQPLPGKKKIHFFWQNEQREKYRKELEDLKNRQKQETEDLRKKRKQETEDLRKKRKQETEDLKKKTENDKAQKEALKKKVMEKQAESMLAAQEIINERNKQILEVKKNDNTIEVITSKEDPLYIQKAQVLKSKTSFMRINDVEFKYKLELLNQTPKIINFVLIVWERKLAFNETQTLAKEVKVSKPIIPYENRVVEYNELDSRREGETYKVEIAKIVFEDGTQWKNPAVKDKEL